MLKKLILGIFCVYSLLNLALAETGSTEVFFVEKEPGVDKANIRMILTSDFLRIDAGIDAGDFILFDRKKKLIQNVVHSDKTILSIPYTGFKLQPLAPNIKIEKQEAELPDAPKIAEFPLKQIITKVNGKDCKKTIVAVGLLPKATAAMQELNSVLADQYARSLSRMLLNSDIAICDMVISAYEVNADLGYGFPVQSNRNNGWSRSLVDFEQNSEFDSKLFNVPEDYRSYNLL